MKNLKKLASCILCTLFVSMQVSYAVIDTGLGQGIGGAEINNVKGGFTGINKGVNSADLNFNGNSIVNWNNLNLNKGETLNFNAVNGSGNLTILNTVNQGMSKLYGDINANKGIGNLIISNPNGVLFDGTHFTAAGDLTISTQNMSNVTLEDLRNNNFTNAAFSKVNDKYGNPVSIEMKNGATFEVAGKYNIVTPGMKISIGGEQKLVTNNGQDFLEFHANNCCHCKQTIENNGNVLVVEVENQNISHNPNHITHNHNHYGHNDFHNNHGMNNNHVHGHNNFNNNHSMNNNHFPGNHNFDNNKVVAQKLEYFDKSVFEDNGNHFGHNDQFGRQDFHKDNFGRNNDQFGKQNFHKDNFGRNNDQFGKQDFHKDNFGKNNNQFAKQDFHKDNFGRNNDQFGKQDFHKDNFGKNYDQFGKQDFHKDNFGKNNDQFGKQDFHKDNFGRNNDQFGKQDFHKDNFGKNNNQFTKQDFHKDNFGKNNNQFNKPDFNKNDFGKNNCINNDKIETVDNTKLSEKYYVRALQKYMMGDLQGSKADLSKSIQNNAKNADAYYYRAAINKQLGDMQGFESDYTQAVSLNPYFINSKFSNSVALAH